MLAKAHAEGLTYAGSAFIALSGNERQELSARLAASKVERSPIPKLRFPDAQWVKPQLTARVRHLSGTRYLPCSWPEVPAIVIPAVLELLRPLQRIDRALQRQTIVLIIAFLFRRGAATTNVGVLLPSEVRFSCFEPAVLYLKPNLETWHACGQSALQIGDFEFLRVEDAEYFHFRVIVLGCKANDVDLVSVGRADNFLDLATLYNVDRIGSRGGGGGMIIQAS